MHATRKVKLKDLTPNLTCNLCHGYFVDATTIIECLHSFCRSCIIQHLERSEYCPVCDVHCSSKPLTSIRSDQMLQEIVYKLVPGLFQSEMTKRREFYKQNPTAVSTSQVDAGQTNESYITSDDIIQLSLEYYTTDTKFRESTKRYVKCPAAVSIAILKKLIHGKYDLNNSVQIDVMYGDRILPEDFLLMDIAYKYSWTQNGNKPLQLSYRVKGLIADKKTIQHQRQRPKLKLVPKDKISKKVNGISKQALTYTPEPRKQKAAAALKKPKTTNGPPRPVAAKRRNSKAKVDAAGTPILSPAFKLPPKGEPQSRKRKLSKEIEMELIIESNNNEDSMSPIKKQPRHETNNNEHEMMITNSSGNEVQLRISENGVISATSIISTPNFDRLGLGNGNQTMANPAEKVILNVPKKLVKQSGNAITSRPNGSNGLPAPALVHKSRQEELANGIHNRMQDEAKKLKLAKKAMKIKKFPNGTNEAIGSPKLKARKLAGGTPEQNRAADGKPQKVKKFTVPGSEALRLSMSGGRPNDKASTNGHETSNKLLQRLQSSPISPKKSNGTGSSLNSTVMKRYNTSALNGDLKFTTNTSPLKGSNKSSSVSPIRLPQNINGIEIIPIGAPNQVTPSKKPPKFFKSRASITELTPPDLSSVMPTPNGNHKSIGVGVGTSFSLPHSSVTATISISDPPTPSFSELSLLHSNSNTANNGGSKSSLSPDSLLGANTIETTATTSVMVPIPMSSSYNANTSSQMYRFPSTTSSLPWSANTGAPMLMNHNVPLNLVPYNLMPYYNMQNNAAALQFTAAAFQQQLHLQQIQQQQRNNLAAQLISNQVYGSQSGSNCASGLNHLSNNNNDNNNTLDLSSSSRKHPDLNGDNGDSHGRTGTDTKSNTKKGCKNTPEQIHGNGHEEHEKSPKKKVKVSEASKGSDCSPVRVNKKKSPAKTPRKTSKANGISPLQGHILKHLPIPIAPAISTNTSTILQIPNLIVGLPPEMKLPSSSPLQPTITTEKSSPVPPCSKEALVSGPTHILNPSTEATDDKKETESTADGLAFSRKHPNEEEFDAKSNAAVSALLIMEVDAASSVTVIPACEEGQDDRDSALTSSGNGDISRNENSQSPILVIAEPQEKVSNEKAENVTVDVDPDSTGEPEHTNTLNQADTDHNDEGPASPEPASEEQKVESETDGRKPDEETVPEANEGGETTEEGAGDITVNPEHTEDSVHEPSTLENEAET